MESIVLEAENRTLAAKSALSAILQKGFVPGVAYGDNAAPVTLSVNEKSLQKALHSERGRNAIITLKLGTDSHAVLVKEIQRNPISRSIIHVDFHRISLKKKIEARVPIHVKGESTGVKNAGGVLEHVIREIKVRCLPTEIPTSFDVDITNLNIGQGIKVSELAIPKGVDVLAPLDNVVLHVVAPAKEEEPAPAAAAGAAATPAQPEVIKKGKPEEEGAAARDKKAAAPAAKPDAKK